jgi:LEA14-like dessication related protein
MRLNLRHSIIHVNWFHRFSALLFLTALLPACAPLKPVEFRSVTELKVKDAFTSPAIAANVNFFNPNAFGCTVKKLEADVSLSNTGLTQISFVKQRIPSKEEFSLPLNASVSYSQLLKLIPAAVAGVQSGKDIPVDLTGSVTVKKFLFSKTFPLQVHEKLNLKDLQLR